MKIVICGSMASPQLVEDIFNAGKFLQEQGHEVLFPEDETTSDYSSLTEAEIAPRKNHFIRKHFPKIEASDAILVTNGEKKGIAGYIGANTLLEMGVAMYLNKRIFILNPVTKSVPCYEEVLGMQPTFLNGQLENLK